VYYNDTPTRRVDRYPFDPETGTFGERSTVAVVAEGEGAPDGMTIDEEGGIWVALWGGGAVRRYDQDGRLTEVVELPVSQVTCCTFGGEGRRTLYISTSREGLPADAEPAAGAVFAFDAGVAGARQYAYAG
jgi:sugar lactone lactonase YvrE